MLISKIKPCPCYRLITKRRRKSCLIGSCEMIKNRGAEYRSWSIVINMTIEDHQLFYFMISQCAVFINPSFFCHISYNRIEICLSFSLVFGTVGWAFYLLDFLPVKIVPGTWMPCGQDMKYFFALLCQYRENPCLETINLVVKRSSH